VRVPAVESYPTRSTDHHECAGHRDLSDWLAHLRLKNRAARTLDDYERTVAALMLWSDKPVAEYTLEDLEHFVLLKYGASPGARVRLSHLKGFFDFLYARDRIPKNLGARLEMPKKQGQKVIEVFTEAEIALLTSLGEPEGELCAILFDTGLRKSEARNLQRRHVDLHRGDLTVYEGKGSKDRVIPMTVRVMGAVADLDLIYDLKPTDYLWSTRPGGGNVIRRDEPVSNTAFQTWWCGTAQSRKETPGLAGVLGRAGIPYRPRTKTDEGLHNLHVTRHTFATRLIRRGARLENVQQLMGHSSIQTTVNLYAHLDVEDARAALRLLEVEV
jgi:site-specific recombinase XerD